MITSLWWFFGAHTGGRWDCWQGTKSLLKLSRCKQCTRPRRKETTAMAIEGISLRYFAFCCVVVSRKYSPILLGFPILTSYSNICFLTLFWLGAPILNALSISLSWRNWCCFFPFLKKRGLWTVATSHSFTQFGNLKVILDNLCSLYKSIFLLPNPRNKRRHQIPS